MEFHGGCCGLYKEPPMNTVSREHEYPVELVLRGFDELINELTLWYPKSELDDNTSRELYQMVAEKVDPEAQVSQSTIDESIANERVGRDFHYIDRVNELRTHRVRFECARCLDEVPKSVRTRAERMFEGVILRKTAIIFPSPISPSATNLLVARRNLSTIYHYIGALSALRPPSKPIGMTFPFDF